MKMKNIFIILLIFISSSVFGQDALVQITDYSTFTVSQSTTVPGFDATLAIDGVEAPNNYTSTYYGDDNAYNEGTELDDCENNTPWWEVDLGDCYIVNGVRIQTPNDLSGYYIFMSEFPFNCDDINVILADEGVTYFHVTNTLNELEPLDLPMTTPIQYLRIQGDSYDVPIKLSEVRLYGDITIIGCDGWTDLEKYGEDCDDGIDNDGDGKIDCEDWPCGVGEYFVNVVPPSCPICNDGEICIVTNNHTVQVSIDCGETFFEVENTQKCFTNLGVGDYGVQVKTSFGCFSDCELTLLNSPVGNPSSHCFNGDFEQGSFVEWLGGHGTNYDGNPVFNNHELLNDIENPRHSIIHTAGFVDEYIPVINGNITEFGKYIAKLGNDDPWRGTERLKFDFIVDDNNKNFFFNYAQVIEDPELCFIEGEWREHHEWELPFLEWKIYEKNNESNILFTEKTFSDDPFLKTHEEFEFADIRFKGWTCVNNDLSEYIGKELCIEFINADCAARGHFGYSYIDGICGSGFDPEAVLVSIDAICFDQIEQSTIGIIGEGAGFNQFYWDFKVINSSGEITHFFETEIEIGYYDKIANLINFIQSETGINIECDSRIIIGFNGLGNCETSDRTEKEVSFLCDTYTNNYCSPMYVCGGGNATKATITGDFECEGCTYSWSGGPALYGNEKYKKYPKLDENNVNGDIYGTYSVTITSPEGCVYENEVEVKPPPKSIIGYDLNDYCTNFTTVTVHLVNVNHIEDISFFDSYTGNTYLLYPEYNKNDGNNKYFAAEIPKNEYHDLKLDLSNYSEFDQFPNCYSMEQFQCENDIYLYLEKSPFSQPWLVYHPDIFTPDGDGLNDYFYLSNWNIIENGGGEENDPCLYLELDDENSSINWYRLRIYNRWGNQVYSEILSSLDHPENGVDIRDAKWDGNFNGSPVSEGVYTWTAEIHSCEFNIDWDTECSNFGTNYVTNTEEITILEGDVEVDLYRVNLKTITIPSDLKKLLILIRFDPYICFEGIVFQKF